MQKKILSIGLLAFILIMPQIYIRNYMFIVLIWILSGFFITMIIKLKRFLLWIFLFQILVGVGLVFFGRFSENRFVFDIANFWNISELNLKAIFILFNAINLTICFYTGLILFSLIEKNETITF